MFKAISYFGMMALAMSTSVNANASHITSTANPLELSGPASLGLNICDLVLTAYLGTTSSTYDTITHITGYNEATSPSIDCLDITIVGGYGYVSPTGVAIQELVLHSPMFPTPGNLCATGAFGAPATNISATQVQVNVGTVTVCGPISASLNSDPSESVQYYP